MPCIDDVQAGISLVGAAQILAHQGQVAKDASPQQAALGMVLIVMSQVSL